VSRTNNTDADARALVLKLDGLPLALSTAGAYLEHVTTNFAEYLRLYEASWLKLQRTSPMLSSYEDRSLYTTWQVTYDRIRKENAASAQLLKLWAYFDKQDVWFGLLQRACDTENEWIRKLTEDELSFNEAVRLLCEYGLAHPEPSLGQPSGSAGYGVHSCVHSWTTSVLNGEWDGGLAQLALTCVASQVPSKDVDEWWLLQQRLLQHAARYREFMINGSVSTKGMEWALRNLGILYADQGRLAEAEAMYAQALQGTEEALGAKHTSTLDTVNNLGNLYKNQGRLAEAEAMYDRALQGYEEALGAKHTSTLDIVNNLGVLYENQGRLAEAEAMYDRALQGYEEALGAKHTSTLNTVSNLGNLYNDQGRLAEAEAMYDRALQGYEEALGAKHTSTLDIANNLGVLYKNQGRLAEAEAMYDRALQGYEEVLGPQLLPSYLPALNTFFSFGDLYAKTDREDAAKEMYSQALAGYKSVQGPSSEWCKELERRLQGLQIVSPNLGKRQGERADIESLRSGPLERKHFAISEGNSI
jgi:tetratricopeptide (TPR) repeat protein